MGKEQGVFFGEGARWESLEEIESSAFSVSSDLAALGGDRYIFFEPEQI